MGVALGEFLNKLRDTLGRKVDLGLVGDRGVVHPSLQVRGAQLLEHIGKRSDSLCTAVTSQCPVCAEHRGEAQTEADVYTGSKG